MLYSLPSLADKCAIELANQAAQGWPEESENWEQWRSTVTKFIARLQLRADIQNEFSKATE
jgi:hypothetical protein